MVRKVQSLVLFTRPLLAKLFGSKNDLDVPGGLQTM